MSKTQDERPEVKAAAFAALKDTDGVTEVILTFEDSNETRRLFSALDEQELVDSGWLLLTNPNYRNKNIPPEEWHKMFKLGNRYSSRLEFVKQIGRTEVMNAIKAKEIDRERIPVNVFINPYRVEYRKLDQNKD